MNKEKYFEEYRKHLCREARHLAGFVALYRRLHELRSKKLYEAPITFRTIQEDKARIAGVEALKSFKILRDKYHAHFDGAYFFDLNRLVQEAPLRWEDLDQVKDVIECVINTYSAAYDGRTFKVEPVNATDVDVLLERVWIGACPDAEDV
jgi:hypothetical protein